MPVRRPREWESADAPHHGPRLRISSPANAGPDAPQHRKRWEPAEGPPGILAVRDLQSFHQRADHQPLDKSRDQGSASKTDIPDPPHPLRFIAKLERHA